MHNILKIGKRLCSFFSILSFKLMEFPLDFNGLEFCSGLFCQQAVSLPLSDLQLILSSHIQEVPFTDSILIRESSGGRIGNLCANEKSLHVLLKHFH